MTFNEDSKVKIPTILHLTRLGYQYLSKDGAIWDESTNIFTEIFRESIGRINPGMEPGDLDRLLDELSLLLDYEDLGQAFYERLIEKSGVRLVDFEDFEKTRTLLNDDTIGGMVICDSAEQAKSLFEQFEEIQHPMQLAAQDKPEWHIQRKEQRRVKRAALILHDVGTKDDRKEQIGEFKAGGIDLLFVYNMLLTGFDAPRLKKIYLNRVVRKHNLLQALTRVNRTYRDFRYGYVVDFADISSEFEATNKAYFDSQMIRLVADQFRTQRSIPLNAETSRFINQLVVNEYREEFYGRVA